MAVKYLWGGGTDSPDPITNTKLNQNVEYLDDQIGDAATFGNQFAQDDATTAALVFGYIGGNFRNDNTITVIADGTVALTDATTNYVEVNAAGVTSNAVGFTSGKTPLYVIVTAGGVITSVEDKRSWAFLSNAPGDMLKSIYDTDNSGVVDAADTAPWAGITDKPTEFTPAAHATSHGDGGDDEIAIDASQVTTGTMDVARLPMMEGATSTVAGVAGLPPAPAAGDDTKVLFGDGTFKTPPGALGNVTSVNTRFGDVVLTSDDVGLGNVDNTADVDKPVSDLTQTALDGKQNEFGTQSANRFYGGPISGAAALPTFRAVMIDNLEDVAITAPTDGEVLTYNGTAWVNEAASGGGVALGETSTTAYRGDRGKIAYDHSQLVTGNPHNVTLSDLSITATATQLNYTTGVTSAIQTQLNTKAADSAVVKLTGAQTVAGVKTFSSSPIVSTPTTDMQAANKKYVDDNAGGGGGGASVDATAAEALIAGQIINIKSDGTAQLADATDDTKPAIGFVDAAYASAATATVLLGGIITGLSGLTPGASQYLSTTAGGITETAPTTTGEIVQVLGVALSATSMMFNPEVAFEL